MTRISLRGAIRDSALLADAWPQPAPAAGETFRASKALEKLEAAGKNFDPEEDAVFLARVRKNLPSSLSPRELRRALGPAWRVPPDTNSRDWAVHATNQALSLERRPLDRAIVVTWLDVFPEGRGAQNLAAAAGTAAERHAWPYRQAGRDFQLWDRDAAPGRLGDALLQDDHPDDVLRRAALAPGYYDAQLVRASISRAADHVAAMRPSPATAGCAALLNLVRATGVAPSSLPDVVRALLKPWAERPPAEQLQRQIQQFLLHNVGDPRSHPAQWRQMELALAKRDSKADAAALTQILKRWLVRASFQLFFKLVMASTDNRQQWQRREDFWRFYMEHDHVSEAWFILGDTAERRARAQRQALNEAGGFGRVRAGDGATDTQSALLMKIGDITIAEWSDNGSCCFWEPGAAHIPQLYQNSYDGRYLRNSGIMRDAVIRRNGSPLWVAMRHGGAWEYQFSSHIHMLTGIRNQGSGY